ncbi:hypothetical protein FOZ62_004941, partial [Perkinsus olseni]
PCKCRNIETIEGNVGELFLTAGYKRCIAGQEVTYSPALPSVPTDAASGTTLERDAWPREDPHISAGTERSCGQKGQGRKAPWSQRELSGSKGPHGLTTEESVREGVCGPGKRRIVQDHIAAGPKLAGLVIGHARHYRGYMHRIGRASDPYCQKCQLREAETPRHRAIRCPGVARPQWVHPNGTLGQFSISKERIKALERSLSVGVMDPQVA